MGLQKIRRRRFGDILVSEGVINQEQLQEALARQGDTGESIGEILLSQKLLTETDIVRTICVQFQLPFISPNQYELDNDLIERFEPLYLYQHRVLPLDRIGDLVILALGDIPPEEVEEEISRRLDAELAFYFCAGSEIESFLRTKFSLSQDDLVAADERRHGRKAAARSTPAAPSKSGGGLLDSLDSSWESIFDEAERNLNG